jgi:hypothetical protein
MVGETWRSGVNNGRLYDCHGAAYESVLNLNFRGREGESDVVD